MIVVTTESIPGRSFQVLGLVQGSCIQTKNLFSDFGQGLKNLVGGELKSYTDMMDRSRAMALDRMCQQAAAMGADAVVAMRYATSAIMQSAAEVMAYGTAVKLL